MSVRELSILLLCTLIFQSRCYQQPQVLCVVPVNLSESENDCSALIPKFNCTTCQPLSNYIQNVSEYFTNNTMLIFTDGAHCLSPPPEGETAINITAVSNFTMKGLGNSSYNPSEEGAIHPSSVITCSCHGQRSGILFYKSNTILLENLTIEDCGTEITLQRPDNFTLVSALTFRESYNIRIAQIRMDRSLGFGLDADRNYGYMNVSNSAFLCFRLNNNYTIGGNARLWYSSYNISASEAHNHIRFNTTLRIEHSWFLHGIKQEKAEVPSAGGLTIFIYLPNTTVTIDHIKAINNTGNVAISITDHPEHTSAVTISNSVIANGSAARGGGLRFWIKMEKVKFKKLLLKSYVQHKLVTIKNTTFSNNSAKENGGGLYISHYEGVIFNNIHRFIYIDSCQFIGNYIKNLGKSYTGAAVQVFNHKITASTPHTTPQYFFNFINCTFAHNRLNEIANEGGIINFVSTSGIAINDSNLTSNEGTAISLRDSNVEFGGYILFKNNTATNGGALKFCQFSTMNLPLGHVLIDFINNSATAMGGAIYVAQEQCVETLPPCFFQPVVRKTANIKPRNVNVSLRFFNNSARLAGDAIYGGQIDTCYVIFQFHTYGKKPGPYLSQQIFKKLCSFSGQMNSTHSTVSSTPYSACFCNTLGGALDTLSCDNVTYPRAVIPGQTISIGVAAVGQRKGTIPISSVYFDFSSSTQDNNSQLIINSARSSGYRDRNWCVLLNCTLYSEKEHAHFTLKLQQISPTSLVVRYAHHQHPKLMISIGECPWGFRLTTHPPYMCVCDDLFTDFNISCSIGTQTLTLPGGHFYWLGCSTYQYESTNDTKPECRGSSLAVRCLLGYCKAATISVSPESLDQQCSDGREGVLCGCCKSNYSLALGTSKCLPNCPSYLFYIVSVVCATSGILLILFLIVCNFTISEGTINGLFFYAHIVNKNSDSFFPGSAGTSNANIFRLIIAWLNLDLGFEVCFYKSMTQYQKTWLQFGFLCYVWILELFIIILSRKYIFFTRIFGRNVVKVLATLFLICYAKTLNIAISTLEFASIRHSDGQTFNVWLFDGNLGYLSGKHIPLFFVGIIFCFLICVFTMALLFIQCLQRRSNVCCLQWVERWRPYFEAYTGPCHVHCRFWPGFLFFIRLTLFSFSSILRDKPTVILHITMAACIVVLVLAFVSPHGVYKHWPLNILEFSFLVNLGVVSGLVAIFCHPKSAVIFQFNPAYFVYPSVTLAMLLFAGVLSFHCLKQTFASQHFQKLSQLVTTRRIQLHTHMRNAIQRREEAQPLLNYQNMPQVAQFSQFREPLISEED